MCLKLRRKKGYTNSKDEKIISHNIQTQIYQYTMNVQVNNLRHALEASILLYFLFHIYQTHFDFRNKTFQCSKVELLVRGKSHTEKRN